MKEILTRSLSGFIYVLCLVSAIFYDQVAFLGLIGLFSSLALWEFLRLIKLPTLPFLTLHALGFIGLYLYEMTDIVVSSLLILVLLGNSWATFRCFQHTQKSFIQFEKIFFIVFYLSGSSLFIAYTHTLNWEGQPMYIFWLYLAIWTNNTFAYLVGSQFGKTKISPKISPKKSYEGYWGGALVTLGLVYGIEYFYGAFGSIWWCVGIGIPFFATLGDFIQSFFKRRAGVKDSGHWLPGHGGFYDRMDSVIFTAPFYFFLLKYL